MFEQTIVGEASAFPARTVQQGIFEYEKRVVTAKPDNQLHVSFMTIPPGKSAFPYHWHEGITEAFVILSGSGVVRTSNGEHPVGPGQVIVFPPGPAGAHRITNTSPDEPLRYVDLDTTSNPDVIHYPDSGKTAYAAWSGQAGVWRDLDGVNCYEGEEGAGPDERGR